MAASKERQEKLLKDLRARFCRDFLHHKKWVAAKREWSRFYDGDHWTAEELRVLRDRNQPPIVTNRIKPKIDSMVGMQAGLKVNTRAFDRGLQDFEKAKYISEALRQVEQLNDFDSTELEAFEDQIIDGRGWYKVGIKWDGLEADPQIELRDNEDVVKDRNGKKTDLSDHKQIHESVWVTLEDAKQMFPDHSEDLEACLDLPEDLPALDPHIRLRPDQYESGADGGASQADLPLSEYVNKELREIRLVTTYWRVPFRRTFLAGRGVGVVETTGFSESDIEKAKETFENAVAFSQLGYRLNVATYTYHKVLEFQEDIKPHDKDGKLPYVWVRGFKSRDKEKPWFDYGFVRQMVDPQREVNKRHVKMLHILSTNQVITEQDVVGEDGEKIRQEIAKPDAFVVLPPGGLQRFQHLTRSDIATSQFQLLQESKSHIDEVGIRGEIEGKSQATSGRDFQLRQQMATQSMRKMFSNLRGARRRAFLMALEDVIQPLWTSERLVRISDDPEAGTIVLNQRVTDPATGKQVVINDTSLGKYDLIVEEAPETVTLQGETFEALAGMMEKGVPIPMEMLIESSPIPNKRKILERMQQQQAQMAQAAAAMQGQPPA